MALFWIIVLVFLLYARTLKYNYVIDDNVKRSGYMYEVPLTSPPHEFWSQRPSAWYRLFMIGMHCVNVTVVYLLWGWCPALLFAVHPLSVWGVAWVTGNYYATAAYFTLIAYYILHTFPNWLGALAAAPIFAAALNSTVCPINFPFLFLFISPSWGLTMFIPLGIYFRGKRFTTGIKIRKDINNFKVVRNNEVKVNYLRRPAVMVKVMAKYTFACLFPDKLGFFDPWGEDIKENAKVWNDFHSYNKKFWVSFATCVSVFIAGMLINPVGAIWFFVLISLHSQFNLTGQFYAQRYAYLPLVGMCVVVGTLLQPYPVIAAIVTTILVVRTHCYIPSWKDMQSVWLNDVGTWPENAKSYNNIAQHFMQAPTMQPEVMNLVAFYLLKAERMFPASWEIQMNLACFFARINQLGECLNKTTRAIELLEPLGGIGLPLKLLKQQKIDVEELIKKQGCATISRPTNQGGIDHGTRTEKKRIVKPVGDSELAGRKA